MEIMDHICNFIFELGQLKRIKHEGWKLLGDSNPESVADHSLRAAQIGFILAELEGYQKPEEVCAMLVFHDIAECRIGDVHKIAARYINPDEEQVVRDQIRDLDEVGKDIFDLWEQVDHSDTEAGVIAKDADLLEMAVTAKEYVETGFQYASDWLERIAKKLQTESAHRLLACLRDLHPHEWWKGLKKI
jgi:putative hydrolase of HD superfamily